MGGNARRLLSRPYCPKLIELGNHTKTLTKDAKYGFGRLIDLARAKPVAVASSGRAARRGRALQSRSTNG